MPFSSIYKNVHILVASMKHMGVEGLRLMVADVVSGLRVGVGLEPAVSFVTPAN